MKTKRQKSSSTQSNEYFDEQNMQIIQPYIELFTAFLNQNYNEELETSENLHDVTDISMPEAWYPEARQMKRNIIYHMGPTNSGKTKHAIEALMQAKQGLYLAPLRPLAWEIAETLQKNGKVCNLSTGQES